MGDAACWLDRICLTCGRWVEGDPARGEHCPHCQAELGPRPVDPS